MPKFSVPPEERVQASNTVGTLGTFTVSGLARYERYYPTSSGNLDYSVPATALPIRRAVVQVFEGTSPNGVAIANGFTDDNGNYSLSVTSTTGTSLYVRVQARSTVTNYVADGIGQNSCNGGSWDIRVVNNVTGNSLSQTDPALRAQYAMDSSQFTALLSGTQAMPTLTASLTFSPTPPTPGGVYTARAGAPFALLDTAISAIETACQGRAAINFPTVYMNWSASNTTTSGNKYDGNITTSFFTTEGTAKTGNLYILGKTDVDTDELDNHVVAHEFGHYLENKIYRSDSIGGTHSPGDSLDPRLAFGEGFGNAFSGMVHSDPVYVDTRGSLQQTLGVKIDVSQAPSDTTPVGFKHDDRGPWSETAMGYMLYHFWARRGLFDRIHNVLENYQKTTSAATNGLTFISYYAQNYGNTDDDLTNTWTGLGFLASPLDALCSGSCGALTPVYDPFDADNDLGSEYMTTSARPRRYREGSTGTAFTAPFWQLYRPLSSGLNAATQHDQMTFSGYGATSANLNKFGLRRLYKVTATSTKTTVSVSSISQGSETCSSNDLLDMAVYSKGVLVGLDEATSGATANCPSVTFCTTPGQVYIVEIAGFGTVGSYNISVSP